MEYKGLTFDQIGNKLICFGSNGVVVFTRLYTGVATQLKSKAAPFVIAVHYMAHRTKLAMQTLSTQLLIGKLKRLL